MDRNAANTICRGMAGAELSEPFGPGTDVWKVGGKIFAAIGADAGGVSVKTPDIETADMLIAAGAARKAPYFHRSWVQIPWQAAPDVMRHRIEVSYGLVRRSLPKKAQAGLDA